jgi:glycosyltransferase involved in cell wall biosynthesis
LILGLEWPTAVPGGLNRYVAELHGALSRRLDAVDTVVLAPAPHVVGVHELAVARDSRAGRLWAYRCAIVRLSDAADVLDAHFALVVAPALIRLRRSGLPLVMHFHGPWADEAVATGRRSGRWMRRVVEAVVVHHAQVVVCLSGAMARVAIEGGHASPWKVRVVRPGVDRDRFRPATVSERHLLRTARGLHDDDFVVVVARRLVPRTGVDLLLAAWPRVAERAAANGTRARLTVVGDGPELPALRAWVAGRDDVRFTGAVVDAELAEWYRLADLSVVPSRALEGFGLVVLESLASGTPVVVTNVGGLPEAVAGLAGTSVVAPTSDAIGERVALMASRTVEAAPGAVCRAATKGRGWDDVAATHVALYDGVRVPDAGPERRVVLLDHIARLSGGELAAARLIRALPGTRVHGLLFEDGPLTSMLGAAGATVEVRPLASSVRDMNRADAGRVAPTMAMLATTAGFTARLAWRLRRLRPDVVHANSLKAGLIGGVAAKLAGVPMVWHVRDRLASDYLPSRAARVVRSAIAYLADGVITPSEAVMATIGPAPRRGQVRAVVPDPAPDYGPTRSAAPRPVADPVHVVMVGRLAPWKGQLQFLEAFAAAFPGDGARASIVGDALFGELHYRAAIERRRDELRLTERVTLPGHVDDVAEIYRAADIVVHASVVPEPFGQVVVEALAAGVAVIATDAGGPAEILTHDRDGLLVPPGDVGALAVAMRRLADEPELRARLAAAGAERATQYHAERIGPRVAEVYEAVNAARNRRR